jgi:hypothetical protein
MLGALGIAHLARTPRLVESRVVRLGSDLLWEGAVQY